MASGLKFGSKTAATTPPPRIYGTSSTTPLRNRTEKNCSNYPPRIGRTSPITPLRKIPVYGLAPLFEILNTPLGPTNPFFLTTPLLSVELKLILFFEINQFDNLQPTHVLARWPALERLCTRRWNLANHPHWTSLITCTRSNQGTSVSSQWSGDYDSILVSRQLVQTAYNNRHIAQQLVRRTCTTS